MTWIKHSLPAIIILFFLLCTRPSAALDHVPAFSVTLSGADLSPDPASPAAFIGTVRTGKSTTISIMINVLAPQPVPSPETFTLDLQSLPAINGVSLSTTVGGVEQDSCTTIQSCTIDLHITTDKADILTSRDPSPPGAQPGSYPFAITVRRGGVSQTVPLILKIVSGEIFAFFLDQNGNVIVKDPLVMKQDEKKSVSVISFGFLHDDSLPPSVTISVRAEPSFTGKDEVLFLIKQSCSKEELQLFLGCKSTLEIATTYKTPPGERTIIVSADQIDLNSFTLRIEKSGIFVDFRYFRPFFFDGGGKAKSSCRAIVDTTAAAPGTENNEPLFDFMFSDSKHTSVRSVKGKKTSSVEFVAEIELPPLDFKDTTEFGRCDVKWVAGKTFEATSVADFPFRPDVFFNKEGGGKLSCTGTRSLLIYAYWEAFSVGAANRWTEVELLDKDGHVFSRNGKQVALKKAKKQTDSVTVRMTAEETGVSAGTIVTCKMTEEYYPLQQMRGPKPAQAPLRITASRQTTLDQSCETLREPGFGGSKTIRFIGVSENKAAYDAARNQVLQTFKTHSLLGTAAGMFTLLNVVYPYPATPSGVDDVLQKAAVYQKYCPADFSIYVGVPAGNTVTISETFPLTREMVLFENQKDLPNVFIHEAGHLFGKLDDEYIDPHSASHTLPFSNCLPTTQTVSAGRLVCHEWKDYPTYASCIPGCRKDGHYRSTENNIMNRHWSSQSFSVVQCAWLVENLEKIRNRPHTINFARGMKQCIENIEKNKNSYNLVWEAAAPV